MSKASIIVILLSDYVWDIFQQKATRLVPNCGIYMNSSSVHVSHAEGTRFTCFNGEISFEVVWFIFIDLFLHSNIYLSRFLDYAFMFVPNWTVTMTRSFDMTNLMQVLYMPYESDPLAINHLHRYSIEQPVAIEAINILQVTAETFSGLWASCVLEIQNVTESVDKFSTPSTLLSALGRRHWVFTCDE